ncbi:OmpA family protein [Roseospirillum parvum]|uniref:OmpA family protein n=1 Tax=Roseospirillum parvum TaxID=83401 RepID=A0A1G7UGK8_9PROT|nr:OmpA family protein [Roseospirillum parvum]SDG46478.1 OmpA family protein [Roseospirillum parvum]
MPATEHTATAPGRRPVRATGRLIGGAPLIVAALLLGLGGLAGCSWFEDDPVEPTTAGQSAAAASEAAANQAAAEAEQEALAEGLVPDTANRQYDTESGRRQVSTMRALSEQPENAQVAETPPPPASPSPQPSPAGAVERAGSPPPPPGQADGSFRPADYPPGPGAEDPFASGGTVVISSDGVSSLNSGDQLASLPSVDETGGPYPLSAFNPAMAVSSDLVATIYFNNGSARLSSEAYRVIDQVVDLQRQYGGTLRVVGHASSRTQDMDLVRHRLINLETSLQRADAVTRALLAAGFPADSLYAGAVGDTEPLYLEVMPAGEAGNRRAEIWLDR